MMGSRFNTIHSNGGENTGFHLLIFGLCSSTLMLPRLSVKQKPNWLMSMDTALWIVLTNNVDSFVFKISLPASPILSYAYFFVHSSLRLTLSGNKSNPVLDLEDKSSKHHAMIYRAEAIRRHPELGLTRRGFILFVKDIALGLAHGRFSDRCFTEDIRPALARWCFSVNLDLHTNSQKQLRQYLARS